MREEIKINKSDAQEVLEDEEDNNTSELTKCKKGVQALMGAAILSTKGVVVSATMASYLLLNKGHRFHFSNDFESQFLDHFDTSDDITDFILTSHNDGTPNRRFPSVILEVKSV